MFEIEDLYIMELSLSPDLVTEIDAALTHASLTGKSREHFAAYAIKFALASLQEENDLPEWLDGT